MTDRIGDAEGDLERAKEELESLQEEMTLAIGERNAVATKVKAAEMIVEEDPSPDQLREWFVLHQILPEVSIDGTVSIGTSADPLGQAEAQIAGEAGDFSAIEKNELDFAALLAEEMHLNR
jgi:hypothetical protein